jgi:signal transduction histidine kinase
VELLDNAAKFSPKGSPIIVRVKAEDGDVVISVEDKGPGVPANVQRRMFEPFSQGDMTSVRKVGGAGLGLAVVAGLVRSQGGRVEVQSKPGQGAVFRVVLPRSGL